MWVVGASHEATGFAFFEDNQEDEALAYYETQAHCNRRFIAKVLKAEFLVLESKLGQNGGASVKNGKVRTKVGRRVIDDTVKV